MQHIEDQETTSFMPVIPRLDRLDRLLELLEEKHNSLSRSDFSSRSFVSSTAMENNGDEFKSVSSALEEVQHKGTLVVRLTALEHRVLQLGMEMDEEDTSKSSSSTFQVSETFIPKKQDENQLASHKEMQDFPVIQAQEGTAFAEGVMDERNGQVKSSGQKVKRRRKWLGFLRIRLTC